MCDVRANGVPSAVIGGIAFEKKWKPMGVECEFFIMPCKSLRKRRNLITPNNVKNLKNGVITVGLLISSCTCVCACTGRFGEIHLLTGIAEKME